MNRRQLFGIFVSIACIGAFIYSVNISQLVQALTDIHLGWLAVACVSVILTFVFRGVIWYGVFRSAGVTISLWKSTKIQFIGWATKLVVPAGYVAIQPVIAKKLSNNTTVETEKILSFITVGDILNFAPLYTLTVVGIVTLSLQRAIPQTISMYLILSGVLAIFTIGLIIVGYYKRNVTEAVTLFLITQFNRLVKVVPWQKTDRYQVSVDSINSRLENTYDSIDLLVDNRLFLFFLFGLSHIGVVFYVLIFYATIVSVGVQTTFFVAVLLVLISKVGLLVPLPGGLGGVEAVLFAGLVLLTQGSVVEITIIVVIYRILTYWIVIVLGGLYSGQLY